MVKQSCFTKKLTIHHQLETNQYSHPSQSKSESEPLYQKSNSSKIFFSPTGSMKDLIFFLLVLFMTLQHLPLTNRILLCILTNHELPMEIPK